MERVLSDPGFADDAGAPDDALDAALAAWQRAGEPRGRMPPELLAARLLVPIVALGADGREKSTDMAVVTLRGTDGRVALPAFTSVDRMAAWHSDARPLPISASRAAQAALFEEADLLVLDPAGPVTFLVAGRALRALAAGRVPVPPAEDPEVLAVLRARVGAEAGIMAAALVARAEEAGPDAVLALAVDPVRCADPAPVAHRLAEALAADEVLRDRLDRGLDLAVVPASSLPAGSLLLDNRPGTMDC